MTLRRQLRAVREALPPPDTASVEALAARLEAPAVQEHALAIPAERMRPMELPAHDDRAELPDPHPAHSNAPQADPYRGCS